VDYCGIWLGTPSDILLDIASTRVKGKATTVFHKRSTARRVVIHLVYSTAL
jgi:hypothetical protein